MSSAAHRHPSVVRGTDKGPADQHHRRENEYDEETASLIEFNLEKLGLLHQRQHQHHKHSNSHGRAHGSNNHSKPGRKAVDFNTGVSAAGPSTSSRTSSVQSGANASNKPSHSKRSARGMAGILDLDRTSSRRDRTFVGSECSVCEEPLEHTLRGERILQLTCSHVAHEACFYEYIREFESQYCPTCSAPLGLDSSRGGNVLDLEKLSRIAKPDGFLDDRHRSFASPMPWDAGRMQDPRHTMTQEQMRTSNTPDPHSRSRANTGGSAQMHMRNDSNASAGQMGGSGDYSDHSNAANGRKHDYDVQAMESSVRSPRIALRNPIPAPSVTVRSEFPTLTRSRQQQSLTCLVTVEVPAGKWRPSVEDLRPLSPGGQNANDYRQFRSPAGSQHARNNSTYETQQQLDQVTEELHNRVDNWHGLDCSRFGKLRLHGHIRVGKDRRAWQDLDCYLFTEMLICVKERKQQQQPQYEGPSEQRRPRCTLKGSILIKKHLKDVETFPDENILTLSLSVAELPLFHLQFQEPTQLDMWRKALIEINNPTPQPNARSSEYEGEISGSDNEDYRTSKSKQYSSHMYDPRSGQSIHVPLDIVVVIPISSSMQGLKITLLRDTMKFLVQNLGERDRMGLVTFGSSGGGVPMVGMTSKTWNGWSKVLESIRPVGQKSLRADVVEGANVAMDLLMQRKSANPLSSILLISDSSTADPEGVDFVIQRAEAAKVVIHSFGLGLTHKPDTMIELSTRTKASYTYVKDWMMLRECVAGVMGSLQTTSHQNVKLKLRLPEGSPAKFIKISGALQITKRASGRDAEAALGDMRFGDKRDILVQLAISPDNASGEHMPQDPWESILSGLEALGGTLDSDDQRAHSVEEVPLIQADLIYGDILRDGTIAHLPRPSLLAITMLPANGRTKSMTRPFSPPIPPHPSVVQRRMELLTSDMLTRALTLVSRGQHERAHHLLRETRSILKGLSKGGLPPLPPGSSHGSGPTPTAARTPGLSQPRSKETLNSHPMVPNSPTTNEDATADRKHTPSPPTPGHPPPMSQENPFTAGAGIDGRTMSALDAELESSLEWISHPAVFGRDSRKAVLQAIGVISSQRGYTFRTPAESLWAERIVGIKRLSERSRDWRDLSSEDNGIVEEN